MKRACTVIAALFCLASPARADFFLYTTASSDAAYNNGALASYTGAGLNPNGPFYNLQSIPGTTTATGTMDNNGLATTTEDHARSNSGPYPSAPGIVSTSDVTASLKTGTFSASNADNSDGTAPPGLTAGAEESAHSQFSDTLHFVVTGVGASDITYIQVKYQVSGQVGLNNPLLGSANEKSGFAMNSAFVTTQVIAGTPTTTNATSGSFGPGSGFTAETANQFAFVGTFAITGPSESVQINEALDTSSYLGFSDYSGSVSFVLPSNVTFTSDSGAFLTTAAVPEPSSLVFCGIAGVVGSVVAGVRRKRAWSAILAAQ